MLDAVAGEYFETPIVELDRNVDSQFLGGAPEDFPQAVVHLQVSSGLVKTGLGGCPGVGFLVERMNGLSQHQHASASIMPVMRMTGCR
jgi:hypothetical protein